MTPDEIKTAITGWSGEGTGLQVVEDRSEAGAAFVLGLRSASPGAAGTVPVEVRLDDGADRVTVTSTATTSAAPDKVRELIDSRPAGVTAETGAGGTVITSHVYTDGFSKHALVRAVDEVAKTRSLVDGLAGTGAGAGLSRGGDLDQGLPGGAAAAASQPSPWASPQQSASSFPEPSSAGSPQSSLPAPSFGGSSPAAGGGSYSPLSGQPAAQAQPSAAAFAPTHTVPPQGMQAWAAPDPNGAVVATLGGGLPIQVTDVRGAWAHVLCSNGWTGWVDGRIIGVAR